MNHADVLIQRARTATSLQDFGDDSFREGLGVLVKSLTEEARLNDIGRAATDAQIVGLLSQRLQVEEWYRRHPEIDEQEIVAPLIGLGLPRTGSTALSCLLAEDMAVRCIRQWEAHSPCPPPEKISEHSDPRIAEAEEAVARMSKLFPRMQSMLPTSATAPTECQSFMAMDFKSQLFQASSTIPSYVEWLNHKADLVPTYTFVKRILKLLQWRCPPTRWRLKNPSHILFIDALDKVFPDARYWMTHRDIAKVLPSVSDLYFEMHKPFSDHIDKHWLGRVNIEFCEVGMQRMIAFRDAGNEQRFFDIQFASFQADPFPILQGLYDFVGEEFTEETKQRMAAWRANTPREKHGTHTYDAADFGLDITELNERFSFYSKRFAPQRPHRS